MENPTVLSPSSSSSGSGRKSSASNSSEFEFWMLRNPSCPQTFLHSADELFSGGVLLPLHQLHAQNPPHKTTTSNPPTTTTATDPNSSPISDPETTLIAPKRWKDMFKKNPENKKKERNGGAGGVAELNINLWPFSRSKSAGNAGPRPPASGRKVSSAPCSRSNSAGESKSKKWPGSPNRGGVHVGRSSPVWQMKRVGSGRSLHDNLLVRNAAEKGALGKEKPESRRSKKGTTAAGGDPKVAGSGVGAKVKVMNLNVQTCIGYRHHLGCRSDEIQEGKSIRVVAGVETASTGVLPGVEGPRGSNLFNLKNLFAKKVY